MEEQAKGWVTATVLPKSGNHYAPHQRDLQTGSILILTSQRPPARQVQSWLQRGLAAAPSVAKASLLSSSAEQLDAAHAPHNRSPSPLPGDSPSGMPQSARAPFGIHRCRMMRAWRGACRHGSLPGRVSACTDCMSLCGVARDEEDGQIPGDSHPGAQQDSDSAMPELSAAAVPQRTAQNRCTGIHAQVST